MMQAARTPTHGPVDPPYWTQNAAPNIQPPTRPAPSPSPSHFPAPEPEAARSRLPRTTSLVPPRHSVSPPEQSALASSTAQPARRIGNGAPRADDVEQRFRPDTSGGRFVNRWSTSTGSSRSNSISHPRAPQHKHRNSSVDTTFLLTSSPPSAKRSSRKLQKSRQFSDQSGSVSHSPSAGSPARSKPTRSPHFGLPSFEPLPSLEQDYSAALVHEANTQKDLPQAPQATIRSGTTDSQRQGAVDMHTMQYEQGQDAQLHGTQEHARNRPGKGSADSGKIRSNKPSQKAMLSRALQKANYAVQLDNHQDIAGARAAYGEACELLQQVLQRTSAQEDKRKLEAIQRTYTSRIDELDQMLPWQDSKALPAFPDEELDRPRTIVRQASSRQGASPNAETATTNTAVHDNASSPYSAGTGTAPPHWQMETRNPGGHYQDHLQPALPIQPSSPGFLQSSFSRSPVRSRFPENVLRSPEEATHTHAHVSAMQHPSSAAFGTDDFGGPPQDDHPSTADPRGDARRGFDHMRENSQNSWLDPIDESGGSTASSVHSRTSSLGYRRRHIRSGSGDTEAEFDTALDAAIEAAYDDGYEPMEAEEYHQPDPDEEIVANAMRKVELARQRVRQTEREAYEMANEQERERFQLQPQARHYSDHQDTPNDGEGFFDDNSSEEEERMLEEMTREYDMQDLAGQSRHQKMPSVPRESDSSGFTSRTWQSSIGSNLPGTGTTSLSTVTETTRIPSMPKGPAPAVPPPTHALPEIPTQPPSAQTVRSRRLSGQHRKQLKIETTKLTPPLSTEVDDFAQTNSRPLSEEGPASPVDQPPKAATSRRQPVSPTVEQSPIDSRPLASPFGHQAQPDGEENSGGRSSSPSVSKLKKNFSSSSLRSLKSRNMSVSHIDDGGDMSPGTPSSTQWGSSSRTPAIPAIPTSVAANLRERAETSMGGMYLLDDAFHSLESPTDPDQAFPDAPVSLEPCPTDFMLRPFWLMRCLYQTLVHPRGGYLSSKLFVPRDAWRVKGVKLKNIEDKIANCDFLTAALLKLARVDTCDADAMLEEMQSMEGILEQTQASLTRKLGSEVGVQNAGNLFKDASPAVDNDSGSAVPRSTSVSGKSSFSWRRLRSKGSSAALSSQARQGASDSSKETQGLATLPMTAQPTSKPFRRDLSQAQFNGPNAQYMGSLARLFDAAQVIDQIARQVDDPGLRHADKTQVGLELCTRHAAEFFGFYICRFVLADLGMMMDKYIKRGSEWVLV